jgi:addiction module HigA family antidote
MQIHNPPHPGTAIKEALEYLHSSVSEFAAQNHIDGASLASVIRCEAGVTEEMSRRISKAFGQGDSEIWFRMQQSHHEWQKSAQ